MAPLPRLRGQAGGRAHRGCPGFAPLAYRRESVGGPSGGKAWHGPVAIAGLLAQKKFIPEGDGTLKTDTATFGLMVFAVIAIVAALAFFPVLALGPIAEYFSLY